MEKLPDSNVDNNLDWNNNTGGSIFFFGAKEVIKFVGTMIISVLTLGIYPAIIICKKK